MKEHIRWQMTDQPVSPTYKDAEYKKKAEAGMGIIMSDVGAAKNAQ